MAVLDERLGRGGGGDRYRRARREFEGERSSPRNKVRVYIRIHTSARVPPPAAGHGQRTADSGQREQRSRRDVLPVFQAFHRSQTRASSLQRSMPSQEEARPPSGNRGTAHGIRGVACTRVGACPSHGRGGDHEATTAIARCKPGLLEEAGVLIFFTTRAAWRPAPFLRPSQRPRRKSERANARVGSRDDRRRGYQRV